jgi:CubicO group peptidase (beta-lactamase class C family)
MSLAGTQEPGDRHRPTGELAAAIDAAVQRHGLGTFWGAVLVTKDGETVLARGYGLADESLEPINADSLFDIGSNAKSFTALALLLLEKDGALQLDDAVTRFFPNAGTLAENITLLDLMTHTSGLSDMNALQRLDFPDRDEAVRLAFASGATSPPGEQFAYCNAGYVVLAAVVEQASGQSLESLLRERVFVPAGMTNTGFLDGAHLDLEHATTRAKATGPTGRPLRVDILDDGWGWGLRGAGGMLTTPNDLARFHAALMGGSIIPVEDVDRFLAPLRFGYGFGWNSEPSPRLTRRVVHRGGTRGYRSTIALYPDDGVMIAVFCNTTWYPDRIEGRIAHVIWPDTSPAIDARILVNDVVMTPDGVILLDGTGRWRVEVAEARIRLLLEVAASASEVARIEMSIAEAVKLASSIETIVGRDPADHGRGTTMHVAPIPYDIDEDGSFHLPDTVEWIVMPQYRGMQDGVAVVDARTTVVLADADNSFWPVMLKMEHADAGALARALSSAVESIIPSQ